MLVNLLVFKDTPNLLENSNLAQINMLENPELDLFDTDFFCHKFES